MNINAVSAAMRQRESKLRVIVLGYIVRGPLGGLAWHHLQYVMGLSELGHDVYYLEDSDDYPSCWDLAKGMLGTDPSYGLSFAKNAFRRIGLPARWAYYDAHRAGWMGPCSHRIRDLCATADVLVNVSGINPLRPWFSRIPVRVLIDTDPVFTQLRHIGQPDSLAEARRHTAFLSFAENISDGRAEIPDDGVPWKATRQPVVLSAWPVSLGPSEGRFTTIMQWDSYPVRQYGGVRYGMKSDGFAPYMALPQHCGQTLELAVSGLPAAQRRLLRRSGWLLRSPRGPSRDPRSYQCYIRESKAEFSVAKEGYVISRSGWFSERSAAYLASGRPVVVQDTGFSDWLPADAGVIAFRTPEQALAGIEAVNGRYEFHCRAARAVAEDYFNSDMVLSDLLERCLATQSAGAGAEKR